MLSRRKFLGQLGAAAIVPTGFLALTGKAPHSQQILHYTLTLERVEGEGEKARWKVGGTTPAGRAEKDLSEAFSRRIEARMKDGAKTLWEVRYRPV